MIGNNRTIVRAATPTATARFNAGGAVIVEHVQAVVVTSATAGNRIVALEILDASNNVVERYSAGTTQAASLTRRYSFIPGSTRETAFSNNEIAVPIPRVRLYDGWYVALTDTAAIDAAADTYAVVYGLEEE